MDGYLNPFSLVYAIFFPWPLHTLVFFLQKSINHHYFNRSFEQVPIVRQKKAFFEQKIWSFGLMENISFKFFNVLLGYYGFILCNFEWDIFGFLDPKTWGLLSNAVLFTKLRFFINFSCWYKFVDGINKLRYAKC